MDSNRNLGRPVKAFKDISERSKRRRVKEVREGLDAELIQRAAVPTRFSAEKALALIYTYNSECALFLCRMRPRKPHGR